MEKWNNRFREEANRDLRERIAAIAKSGEESRSSQGSFLRQVKPTFFSALAREIGGLSKIANKDGMVKPDQAKAWITARQQEGKFKKAEVDSIGLMDYLDLRKTPVAVMTIEEFVKEKGVQIEEVINREAPEIKERTVESFLDAALEKLTRMDTLSGVTYTRNDPDVLFVAKSMHEEYLFNYENFTAVDETSYSEYQEPGGEDYTELLLTLPLNKKGSFEDPHFNERNLVAHVRFNTRTDVDGKKVLFLEELQSDWAQIGKKKGFRQEGQGLSSEEMTRWERLLDKGRRNITGDDLVEFELLSAKKDAVSGSVPAAPFVTDTQAWTALVLKRMLRYAVDNDISIVSWTTGEMQASRYDLSRYVSEVHYDPKSQRLQAYAKDGYSPIISEIVAPDKLADYIGKDAAEKLLAKKTTNIPTDKGVVPTQVLKNLELKVGGEGMAAYYDAIVPQVAKKIIKSIGGELGKSHIEEMANTQAIHITQKMRDNILSGLALFQPAEGQESARGGFDPTTLTTILGTEADNSTFLHETAHFFLSVYADMAANLIALIFSTSLWAWEFFN